MDKNKFWLGGRLFNTASPRLGAPTQRKARPQDGRPNATQGTSASWAPQHNAWHVRELGAPRHVRNARHVRKASRPEGRPTPRRVAKRSAQPTKPNEPATEVRWGKNLGFPEGTQGESARGAPNTEASRQEQRPTNKTQRAGDRGAVG
jgi:hypothetical protein